MPKIALFLAQGFEEVEAITPIDLLRRANIQVDVVGITGKTVTGARGINVVTDKSIDEIDSNYDGLIIPGGMPGSSNVAANPKAMSLIQDYAKNNKLVAAICAAPAVVLEKAGVLKNKKVVCYPGLEKNFKDGIFEDKKVIIDENIITSKGVGTAIEFALSIITYLTDPDVSDDIAKAILYQWN